MTKDKAPDAPSHPPKIIQVIEHILISLLVAVATVSAGIVYLVKFICCR